MKDDQLKRYYFNGMKEACAQASLHEDARALCPEITVNMVSKRIDFKMFTNHLQSGAGNLALLHSDWWNAAVNMTEPVLEDIRFAFTQLTLQRNKFISGCSILWIAYRSQPDERPFSP
jgi:hypothetical protein